jgi:peptide/nickel transport system permease protein
VGNRFALDDSQDANNIQLEQALLKPGTSVVILETLTEKIIVDSLKEDSSKVHFRRINETKWESLSRDDFVKAEINEKHYMLGTDRYGRDLLSRVLLGARVSMLVGFASVLISLLVGIMFGLIAGFYGGWVDKMVMWLVNVIWSLPTLLIAIAVMIAFGGKGFIQVFLAIGLTMWVELTRIVRGQVLQLREKEFIQAAQVLGMSNMRIMLRHILPNLVGPIIVVAASNFASAILLEAGLSFLGIGVQPPTPSWGNMVKEHYIYIVSDGAYLAIIPGLAIMFLVMSFNILGNGFRDAMDINLND